MGRIIKNGAIVDDAWQLLQLAEGETPESVALPAADTLYPLAVWRARKDEIVAGGKGIGLVLQPDEQVEDVADELHYFQVIAVSFPKFVDGRGFSTAALLRQRYAYQGEVRAIGDVLHDTLFYMQRVGFDAFALRADKSAEYAVEKAFATFSERYQAASDQPQPFFRRRSA